MRSALLIIDMQTIFFGVEPSPVDAALVIRRINQLSSSARAKDIPVILIQHDAEDDERLRYGSQGWQLIPELIVAPSDHRVSKQSYSAFEKSNLLPILLELDIQQLVICGYATDCCIDATVRSASDLGFHMTIVADAHTTHSESAEEGRKLRNKYNAQFLRLSSCESLIQVVPSQMVQW
jgi:Amidases related to nicotinamidase